MSSVKRLNDSFEEPSTPKKKRRIRNELHKNEKDKHRKQKYRVEWEGKDEFTTWLKPVKNNIYRARCIKCNVDFVSELGCLKNHLKSKNHIN